MTEELILSDRANPNFEFEMWQHVKKIKEKDVKKTVGNFVRCIVIGRVHWGDFENEYIIVPESDQKNLSRMEQVPESKLKKLRKPNK